MIWLNETLTIFSWLIGLVYNGLSLMPMISKIGRLNFSSYGFYLVTQLSDKTLFLEDLRLRSHIVKSVKAPKL